MSTGISLILCVVAAVLLVVGFIGTFVPVLPGAPLAWAGLLAAYFSEYNSISILCLVITGVVALVVSIVDNFFPVTMTKKFGGSKYATTGDGVLTAIKILEICVEKKCSISSLVSDVTIFPQILINVRVEKMDEVLERPELKEVTDAITAKLGDTGRILLRKSGTEPLVRIMVEAQTDEECEKYANEIKDKILELSESMN